MPFLIDATYKTDQAELRARLRPAHLAFLEANLDMLLAAGAKLSDDGTAPFGSFYIVNTDDRTAAEAFIKNDPYVQAGLFGTLAMTRWRKGFFNFQKQIPGAG